MEKVGKLLTEVVLAQTKPHPVSQESLISHFER